MNGIVQMLSQPMGHRLGWTLVHSIWEGAAIAAAFAVVRVGLRHWSASARYIAACVALLTLLAAPVFTVFWTTPLALPQARALTDGILAPDAGLTFASSTQSLAIATISPDYINRTAELLESVAALDTTVLGPWGNGIFLPLVARESVGTASQDKRYVTA